MAGSGAAGGWPGVACLRPAVLTRIYMMHDPYSRMAFGMSVGVALGAAIGTAIDNLGIGIALGIALGAGASTVFGDRSQK